MRAIALKYAEVARITVRARFAYLWDLIGSTLFLAVVMYVFVCLWTLTYKSQGASIEGFSLKQMIWYLVATETIILSAIPIHRTIEREIRDGDVAIRLNKPYSYLLFHLSMGLGEAAVKAIFLLLVGGLVAFLSVGGFDFKPESLPPLLVTFVVTMAVNLLYGAIIGLSAFWTEEISGLFFIMDRLKWLVGGFFMPITLFPEPLATIAKLAPFRWMIYEPARLVVDFDWGRWLQVMGSQLVLLMVLVGITQGLYRLGIRRLNANGG